MKLIVAADRNWAIGRNGGLLVNIPADLKRFREMTTGRVVVMGRKTLESFPGGLPLKNRVNIVLTKNKDYTKKGAVIVHSLEELMEELAKYPSEDIFVIGGESIYRMLLPYCDTAYVTRIDYAYEADTWMPDLDREPGWRRVERSEEQTVFDLIYYYDLYTYEKG